jgi:uncharacterized phage protein (TIGR01671 family)
MRTIKFRAWYPDIKEMIYDFVGIANQSIASADIITTDKLAQYLLPVMQFTGLTDKNGKEIYEGDVVYLSGYGNYQVEFPFIQLYEAGWENDIGEVIGNIYENPDLLTKSNET